MVAWGNAGGCGGNKDVAGGAGAAEKRSNPVDVAGACGGNCVVDDGPTILKISHS